MDALEKANRVKRITGRRIRPDEATLLRWVMAHGEGLRLVYLTRDDLDDGTSVYTCFVDQEGFEPDADLWSTLANAVVALSARA